MILLLCLEMLLKCNFDIVFGHFGLSVQVCYQNVSVCVSDFQSKVHISVYFVRSVLRQNKTEHQCSQHLLFGPRRAQVCVCVPGSEEP